MYFLTSNHKKCCSVMEEIELEVSHTLESLEEDTERVQEMGDQVRATATALSRLSLQVNEAIDQCKNTLSLDSLTAEQIRLIYTDHNDRELCRLLFSKSKLEWLWCTALGLPIRLINWLRIELVRLYLVAFPANQLVMRGCLNNCRYVLQLIFGHKEPE